MDVFVRKIPYSWRCGLVAMTILQSGCHNQDDSRNQNVPAPVIASIELTPASDYILVGNTLQLNATIRAAQGDVLTNRTLTWTSSDQSVVSVSTSGLVSSIAPGTVTVTAAAEGKIGVANLTVASITLVHINGPTYAMEPGTTTQLAASVLDSAYHPVPIPVTWSSLDNSIATVSSSGLVNVHTIGVATISASVGSVTGSFDIGVQHAVTGKIAFVSKRGRIICSYCDNQAGGIYLMNVDGSQQELLIEDQIMRCNPDPGPPNELCFFPWQEPSLAKDGLRLAAISQVRYDTEYSGSMMFLCTITPPSCSILDYPIEIRRPWIYTVPRVALVGVSSPAWSPNGATMAFGYGGIGVWNFVSGVGSRVDPDQGEQPTWSPDGIHIAFTSRRNGNNDIWMMNADGSNLVNLTNNAGEDSQPTWAPDGNRIAFVSNRDGNDEIYIMNRDGSSQTNVSHNVASDAHPTWSPDGTQIAFQTDRDGNSEIYVMYADGSNQTNITRNPAEDTSPSWGP